MTKPKGDVIAPPSDASVVAAFELDDVDAETMQRAWRAVGEFRKMLPTMRAFIQAITRNPNMKVEITNGTPMTDGKTVWLRAPIKLGDNRTHDRANCSYRDPNTLLQICPACAVWEEIMTDLVHECAHKVFDSFESLREQDRMDIILRVLNERPGINGTRLAKLQAIVDAEPELNYVKLNNLISPYLPVIFNALEDARVNRMMYTARPGTKVWFQASTITVFETGIERMDGSFAKWDEVGPNSQMIIGLFCRASGFKTKGWFSPEIEESLADPGLGELLTRMMTARSAASVYRIGFPMLERLRELGYCKRLGEPEDDPPPVSIGAPGKSEDSQPGKGGKGDATPSIVPEQGDDEGNGSGSGSGVVAPEDLYSPPSKSSGKDSDADDTDESDDESRDTDDEGDDDTGEEDDNSGDDEQGSDEETDDGAGHEDEQDRDGDDDSDDGDDTESDSDEESASGSDGDDSDTTDDDGTQDADECFRDFQVFSGHSDEPPSPQKIAEDKAIEMATAQAGQFDAPSVTIAGVNVHRYDTRDNRARRLCWRDWSNVDPSEVIPPESILTQSLWIMRKTFAFNKASRTQHNLRHGRVHGPSAHRVMTGDKDIFARTRVPGRRQYKVLVGLDKSGSTIGRRSVMINQAGYAMAELLSRTGVGFAIYGHTGSYSHRDGGYFDGSRGVLWDVDQFEVKAFNDPWAPMQKEALVNLHGADCNLDGHSLEFYRKRMELEQATDKLIVYFTDGEMPYENYDDELVVLQREIKMCQRLGIALLGVGVNTDSPTRHGLDTVRIDGLEDIPTLIKEIESRLVKVQS